MNFHKKSKELVGTMMEVSLNSAEEADNGTRNVAYSTS